MNRTQNSIEAIERHASDAQTLYVAGDDKRAKSALASVSAEMTILNLSPPWVPYDAGPVDPPDPPPGDVDWESYDLHGGDGYLLSEWKPTEDDLQRRLPLVGTEWSKISVFVDFVPADGWRENPDSNFSGGQLTQGPLNSPHYSWTTSLLGSAAIKGSAKVRFVASVVGEEDNNGETAGLGGLRSLEFHWTPGALDFDTNERPGDVLSLVQPGTETVFAIGNNADGNHPGDAWSLGWEYTVRVEAFR